MIDVVLGRPRRLEVLLVERHEPLPPAQEERSARPHEVLHVLVRRALREPAHVLAAELPVLPRRARARKEGSVSACLARALLLARRRGRRDDRRPPRASARGEIQPRVVLGRARSRVVWLVCVSSVRRGGRARVPLRASACTARASSLPYRSHGSESIISHSVPCTGRAGSCTSLAGGARGA